MIISQLSIAPVGTGTSLSKYVRKALEIIKNSNVNYKINDMGTVIETRDLETLFDVVKRAHEAVLNTGAGRVITELKIDDRRDSDVRIGSKKSAVE